METLIKSVEDAILSQNHSIKYHSEKLKTDTDYHSKAIADAEDKKLTLESELAALKQMLEATK